MSQLDDEIDRLYRLPAAEFVGARNALAKSAGPQAAAIKSLQKPNAAAWAVNQLFWRRRKVFDQLVDAARKLRAAHGQLLSGKRTDVAVAETAHRSALKAATEEVRDILGETGETASPATMVAVSDTLQALPGPDPAGRLSRELKPLGFEALAGLVPGAAAASKRLAEIVPIERARPQSARLGARIGGQEVSAQRGAKVEALTARRAIETAKREAEAKKRETAKVEAQLRAARAAERRTQTALARARQALTRVEREEERLKRQLGTVAERVQRLSEQVRSHERAFRWAEAERTRLEALLR